MRFATALLFLACVSSTALAQSPAEIGRAGDAYRAGRFQEAAELYDSAIKAGETSAPLFYNTGNAWFRGGDFGRAILNYERALVLEPGHPEAQANLQVARDKARALQLIGSRLDQLLGRIQPNHYTIAAAAALWIALLALAVFSFRPRRSGALVALGLAAVLVLAGAVAALYRLETGDKGRSFAIVTSPKIEARLATADSAGSVLALPAGSEIAILSTRGDWSYAALPNGLRGWIPADSAERVRL